MLDLGSGPNPEEGYVGVDLPEEATPEPLSSFANVMRPSQPHVDSRGVIRFDLGSGWPWPFEDHSIDGLRSSHLIEHLPCADVLCYDRSSLGPLDAVPEGCAYLRRVGRRDALLRFMDEAWRVTKPGGRFLLRWPALVDQETGAFQVAPFQDPTHRRFIPLEQIHYWSYQGRRDLGVEQYAVSCDWILVSISQRKQGTAPRYVLVENEVVLERGPRTGLERGPS